MTIYNIARAFMREVAAYAAVPGHDNIVRLLDVGAAPGHNVFAAFEYHDSPLSALMQAEAPPLQREEVRHIAAAVLRGLAHMHRHGVLHCDVKPANVLVSGRGLQGGLRLCGPGLVRGLCRAAATASGAPAGGRGGPRSRHPGGRPAARATSGRGQHRRRGPLVQPPPPNLPWAT